MPSEETAEPLESEVERGEAVGRVRESPVLVNGR